MSKLKFSDVLNLEFSDEIDELLHATEEEFKTTLNLGEITPTYYRECSVEHSQIWLEIRDKKLVHHYHRALLLGDDKVAKRLSWYAIGRGISLDWRD